MHRFLVRSLYVCCLFTFTYAVAAESADVPYSVPDFAHSRANLAVTRSSPERTRIALESPEITTQSQTIDYREYQSFGIAGEVLASVAGAPMVPQVTRFYRIPNTGGTDLIITTAEFNVVDNVDPLPLQVGGSGFNGLRRNEAVYARDGWYPENVAVMSDPMIMRDFRVVTVSLYPVQVNPVTHQARIYRNLSVDVVANNRPGANELLHPRRPSGEWAPIYRSMIANLDDHALDDMTTAPGSLLILTASNYIPRPFADSLAEWKTRMGFKVTVDARANWTSSQAITDIRAAYANAPDDQPLEFVVLMGDPGAAWGIPIDGDAYSGNYDHSYALANTGDDLEDIGVGRLSGGTAMSLATINAKIMGYERSPHVESSPGVADTMWFRKALLYAGVARGSADHYLMMEWGKQQFVENTGVDSVTVAVSTSDQIDIQYVLSQLNAGVGYFFWNGTWIGDMPSSLPEQCVPGWRLPICVTMEEAAGEYAYSPGPDGPAENFLCAGTVYNPKGGVCGIGTSSARTEYVPKIILTSGLFYNIADLHVEHIGTATAAAKSQLFYSYGPYQSDPEGGLIAPNQTRLLNLLGDPSLSMWTDVPKTLSVTRPDSLIVGASSVEITVSRAADGLPVEDAVVCLWKRNPDSTWVRGTTDANGQITLPVTVRQSGSMDLTVTKRNFQPYLFTIPCAQASAAPMFSSVLLDDDNNGGTVGNGDHLMNPGETIDLPVYVRNFGNEIAATGISATLTSSDPIVMVVSGTSAFGNIAPDDSTLAATPFRIHIRPSLQDNVRIMLPLTITSSAGVTVGAISIYSHAGNAQYERHQLSDTLDPGRTVDLTVVVRNVGSAPMTGVTGHLAPLVPLVHVDVATVSFGDMAVGAMDSNSTPFSITADTMAIRGLQAPMRLVLMTSEGFADTTQFNVSVATAQTTDPTGPDAYGYYAYDNTDTSYELHPTFAYVDISTTGDNLNIDDSGEKTNYLSLWSAVRCLPYGFKFYGQVYDSITICSNGWCAFGNQGWDDAFRNYQIPGMRAPDAMIAPYWDDLKTAGAGFGVYAMNDTSNHRYIIQWKAAGWGGSSFSTPLDFEVILYDTTYRETYTGDGNVVVQYNDVMMDLPAQYGDDPPGCTIGIQKPGNIVGLQYAYQATYAPGAAIVQDGRAILFTTDTRTLFGHIQGTVRNAADDQPMAGATVEIDGFAYQATTDAVGHYVLRDVHIGVFNMHAGHYRFDDDSVSSVLVPFGDTATVNFALHHPEMSLTPGSLRDTVRDAPVQSAFTISNPGNGRLDFSTQVYLAGYEHTIPWESIGTIEISRLAGDNQAWGCEIFDDEWWVTGSSGPNRTPTLYRFNLDGQLMSSVPQPFTTAAGWFDLATDGNLLYGSDNHMIFGIDASGAVRDSIHSPLNPSRAIAYDPLSEHFWIADYSSDIYVIDRQGNQLANVANPGLNITGLGWYAADPDTGRLYIFSRDSSSQLRVSKYNPVSGRFRTVRDLPASSGDRAAGCTITSGWNSMLPVFGGVVRSSTTARLAIHEIAFDTSWLRIFPAAGNVAGNGSQNVLLTFDGANLRDATYHVNLHITSAIYDSTMVLPITLVVSHAVAADPAPVVTPARYALLQNYPNPFNPTTNIRYELKTEGLTRLAVFNVLGEKVAELVDAQQPAGYYEVHFNASELPSGVYFYHLTSGNFVQSAKMLLLK